MDKQRDCIKLYARALANSDILIVVFLKHAELIDSSLIMSKRDGGQLEQAQKTREQILGICSPDL